jgi:hypothetical protein
MKLTELRQYVWDQTDTTEFDLPAATISSYLHEAFQRTIAAENRWPFYEKTWTLVVPVGETAAQLDSDVNRPGVVSVYRMDGVRLLHISEEEAESRFGAEILMGDELEPVCYSFWADEIRFWPANAASEETIFGMRGYRKPLTAFLNGTGEVDADPRLHRPLAHYAIALAYAQQEDEVLERTYMERWQRDVEMARKAIMEADHHRPVIMNGGFPRTPVGGYKAVSAW